MSFEVEASIPERFEQLVREHPERLAVSSHSGDITYERLDRAANQVAHAVLEQGGAGPVAVLCAHDTSAITAILGVTKTGRPYVPLDPLNPTRRTRFVLDDSTATLLLTDHASRACAAEHAAGRIPVLDIEDIDGDVSDERPAIPIQPEDDAYVIYTSGSTGTPKGFVESHRNVLHSIRRLTLGLEVGPSDRLSLVRSFGIIGGVRDMFLALLNGATACPFDLRMEGVTALVTWIGGAQVTILTIAATVFRQLAQALDGAGHFPRLRVLQVGGEAITREDLERYRRHFPDSCLLVNSFGTTETGTISLLAADKQTAVDSAVLPVGRAVEGVEVQIQDAVGRAVAAGEHGEIVVRSRYMGSGYWRRPELTAASFGTSGAAQDVISFRTGDMGLALPDGQLLYLGRKDKQVKVRGYRVEVAEVEACLRALGSVEQAVVGMAPGCAAEAEARLVAWVVPAAGALPTVSGLRAELAERLPGYMIPDAYLVLDALPMTPSGKVDHGALPVPGARRPALDLPFVAPRNELQVTLAKAYADVLSQDQDVLQVGIHDDFFELGGNSLLALRVSFRLEAALRMAVGVRAVFECPTVAGLAVRLAEAPQRNLGSQRIAVVPRGGPLPLAPAQRRLWILHQIQDPGVAYTIALGLRMRGPLDVPVLRGALHALVRRHEALRTVFPSTDGVPEPRQQVKTREAAHFVLRESSVMGLPSEDRAAAADRQAEVEARLPFDLASGPLLRGLLIQVGAERHLLVLSVHHMVFDGWSVGVALSELVLHYEGATGDARVDAPELPVQYADFAVWQARQLAGPSLRTHLDYWRRRLLGAPAITELPAARPRPGVPRFVGALRVREHPDALLLALKSLARSHGASLVMVLSATFAALLHRRTGSRDVVFGAAFAGRGHPALEQLVGFFSNTLPLRSDLREFTGPVGFATLLARIRSATLEALEHQDMPFDQLVGELQAKRDASRNPVFQLGFHHRDLAAVAVRMGSVELSLDAIGTGTSKLDLTWTTCESPAGLSSSVEYSTDLFDEQQITELLADYEELLQRNCLPEDPSIAQG